MPSLLGGVAAGLLVGCSLCLSLRIPREDEAEERRKKMKSRPNDSPTPDHVQHNLGWHVNSRGMVLCKQQFLPKDGRVLGVVGVCHGFTDHCHGLLLDLAYKLCGDGYAVVMMDVEGHGLSDGIHCAIHDFKALAVDLCDFFLDQLNLSLFDKKPFFLYGVSMGGANVFNLCTLPECNKLQKRINGAILSAPMVKIADEMKPPNVVINALKFLGDIFPFAPVTPVPDILIKCFKEASVYRRAKMHPLHYNKKPRLKTGIVLLEATEDINTRMEELSVPVLLLHGGDDVVTDPKMSEVLHDRCSSKDKTIKIYPGAWHEMLFGEPKEVREKIYRDLMNWITIRTPVH